MDIKKFQLFVDVAETKNFTRSGERMGYTQSGVSHILKSLETEMGFPLFVRNKQGGKIDEKCGGDLAFGSRIAFPIRNSGADGE